MSDLRQITATLSLEAVALECEVAASADAPTIAAVNKLQAVLGGLELASVIAHRLVKDVHRHLRLPSTDCGSAEERLSAREREVFGMLVQGWTVSQTAARLALSAKTVSTYRARILQKCGYATTAELMRYGISHHFDS